MLTSWEKELGKALKDAGESWDDVVDNTMTLEQMRAGFDAGYGGTEGVPFTVWTENRVYFPICYDGSEWVESVSRNPDGVATSHLGGG